MIRRIFITILVLFGICTPAAAVVELAREGRSPVTIEEVYLHEGEPYLALDDVLRSLGLSGKWDSVAHVFRIKTDLGTAVISPGSSFIRLGERFISLDQSPRFIDGRLRVSETFVTAPLAQLVRGQIYYRNLHPQVQTVSDDQNPLDRLFAFLLRKKAPANGSALRGVALDPGHGGEDPGAIGTDGLKEKDVALAVARRLEKRLKMNLGIPIFLSRDGDYSLTPKQRFSPAANPEVDVLIQLHAQASLGEGPRGLTLFVRPEEAFEETALPGEQTESMLLAQQLVEALEQDGLLVNGIVKAPLIPLGRGDLPTVLIELGYLSHPEDLALLGDPTGQDRLAAALFKGLNNYADMQKENSH